MKNATLSLVLPTHNVGPRLAAVVQDCLHTVPHYFHDYELIIVDDASQDETPALAYELAATHEPVMVIRHPRRRGYARALLEGFHSARGDYLLSLSPEGRVGIRELERLLPYSDDHDLVMGYRIQRPSSWRCLPAVLLRRLANWLLTLDVHDTGCRFTLLRAELITDMECVSSGSLIHLELYARARQRQAQCVQVGIYDHASGAADTHKASHAFPCAGPWPAPSTVRDVMRLGLGLAFQAPAADSRIPYRSFPKLIGGLGLLAVVRGLWLLLRRRGS